MAEGEEDDGAERNEPATRRRIDKAAEDGQVAMSRESVGFAALLASAFAATLLLPGSVERMAAAMRGTLSRSHDMEASRAAGDWLMVFLWASWPIAAAAVLGAVVATLAQTRGVMALAPITPGLSKISPISGFGRLFGAEGLLEFLRTLLKLCIVGAAIWHVATDLPGFAGILALPPAEIMPAAGHGVLRLLAATLAAFALLAGLDLLLVRHRHLERLRMTRQQVKEEVKESEGDPLIKGHMRQLREAKGRQRMMAAVPRATVIITNPTHYAVALVYEAGQSAAPKLVAKGVDAMAARIRETGRQAGVPLVPDPPLARALHRLDLDAEIPSEHWEAVARIIAYVMRLRGRG